METDGEARTECEVPALSAPLLVSVETPGVTAQSLPLPQLRAA